MRRVLLLTFALGAVLLLGGRTAARAGDEDTPADLPPRLQPLALWLEGEDPILRAMAAFELRHEVEPGAIRLATRALKRETDATVLACALGGLVGRPRVDLVAEGGSLLPALLLRHVEHPHELVAERAWEVLERVRGETPPKVADAWRRWWLASRKALDEEQRRLLEARGEASVPSPTPAAPGERTTTTGEEVPDLYDYVAGLRRDGLELCIVLDHTGSMAPVIGAAVGRAASLVKRLAYLVPGFRAGLVSYDDGARVRIALTHDGEALRKAFRKVGAGGGGDWEEGVDKGIALALRQEMLAWSRKAHRVLVVIGDAPPHEGDVAGLLRRLQQARDDILYDHPIVVHTVSTEPGGVDHFPAIALAGGGVHVTLRDTGRLEEELVALTFGAGFLDRVRPWLAEVAEIRRRMPREKR
jgi:Mg-chelatase subunit ChlD